MGLYAESPLVGWVPREGVPESSRVIRSLPLFADSEDAFRSMVRRLRDEPGFLEETQKAQSDFLQHQIANPHDAGFEQAAELIERELEAHQAA